jgi:hypothetical protein
MLVSIEGTTIPDVRSASTDEETDMSSLLSCTWHLTAGYESRDDVSCALLALIVADVQDFLSNYWRIVFKWLHSFHSATTDLNDYRCESQVCLLRESSS